MRIGPNAIDVDVPRTLFGGLKEAPVQELLHGVLLELERLADENESLRKELERLKHGSTPVTGEVDELASAVLAAAEQGAREMRESARRECELMLKKANSRARKLEGGVRQVRAATETELRELEALRRDACERMRAALQTILTTPEPERSNIPLATSRQTP